MDRAGDRVDAPAVWMLAFGQTLGYACFFYIFGALLLAWTEALGWDKAFLALGPTLAIVIAAAIAPFAGRLVDRGLGPALLTGGALLGAAALGLLAVADAPATYLAAWALLGLAQAACLYEVAFAWLIRRCGTAARPAIIRVTLVAGFASTLAFPAGAALAEAFGWRAAVWAAAAVAAGVMAPLHHAAGVRLRRGQPPEGALSEADRSGLRRAFARRAFWLLALGFALISLNHWMLMQLIVPLLVAKGATPAAAVLAAACIGPAQVVGRLVLMRWEARLGTARVAWATMAGLLAAAAVLALAGLAPVLVFAFAVLQGAAMGVMTILRPTLTAETMGRDGYGAVSGALQVPSLLAAAAAPMLGALILGQGGSAALTATAMAVALAAAVAVARVARGLPGG